MKAKGWWRRVCMSVLLRVSSCKGIVVKMPALSEEMCKYPRQSDRHKK